LILIITQRTVERRKFSQLVSLEFILSFRYRRGCFDDVVDECFRLVDFFLGICHDETMQVFFLIAGVSCVRSSLAFFNRAFASNGDFGSRFGFHFLERVATRPNK
jgi:hypothetical protein